MNRLRWIAGLALSAALMTQPSSAEDIRLRLKGGSIEVVGNLLAYETGEFRVANKDFGEVRISADRFECLSGPCPKGTEASEEARRTANQPVELKIAGSNTIGNQLMPEIIKAFAVKNGLKAISVSQPDPLDIHFRLINSDGKQVALIKLFRHGSSTSFRALLAGEAKIGMSSRPIKDGEVKKLGEAGLGQMRGTENEHVLGLDGLLVIVAPESPVTALSIEEIAKIFSGQITDWSQLGYPAGPIKVHAPTPDSGTWDTFNSLVLKPRKLKLVKSARRTENHAEQSDWVAGDPMAIGHVGIAYRRSARALNIRTSCGLSVPPSRFAIKTEEYPLSRRLYLYTGGRPKLRVAARLMDFALSDDAQNAVSRADFINRQMATLSFEDHAARMLYATTVPAANFDMAEMVRLNRELNGKERLSFTFRFEPESTELNRKSLQDLRSLGRLMTDGKLRQRAVQLVGFTDAAGDFKLNMTLSEARAKAVKDALLSATAGRIDPNRIKTIGFGELAPVACNDNTKSRAFNRRVEVWVERH